MIQLSGALWQMGTPRNRQKAAHDVTARWERRLILTAKAQKELSVFRQEVEGQRFLNPDTGNKVLFQSLPRREQARIFAEWRRKQRGVEPKRERERGLIEIDREKARSQASRMADEIQKWRIREPDERIGDRFLPGMGGPITYAKMFETSVHGRPRPFSVQLGVGKSGAHLWRAGRHFVSGGAVTFRHLDEEDDGAPLSLRINLNPNVTYRELQDPKSRGRIEQEIYSVMLHELTHARDRMESPAQIRRRKQKIPKPPGLWDPLEEHERREVEHHEGREREYYNRPSEVRAFKRQMAEEVRRELEKIHKVQEFKRERALEKGEEIEEDDPNWISMDADWVLEVLSRSVTWDRVREWLTPQNRRKFLETAASVVRKFKEDQGGKVARRVVAAWLRKATTFAEWVKGRRFKNPATGNYVLFKSLPLKAQAKIREQWRARIAPRPEKLSKLAQTIQERAKTSEPASPDDALRAIMAHINGEASLDPDEAIAILAAKRKHPTLLDPGRREVYRGFTLSSEEFKGMLGHAPDPNGGVLELAEGRWIDPTLGKKGKRVGASWTDDSRIADKFADSPFSGWSVVVVADTEGNNFVGNPDELAEQVYEFNREGARGFAESHARELAEDDLDRDDYNTLEEYEEAVRQEVSLHIEDIMDDIAATFDYSDERETMSVGPVRVKKVLYRPAKGGRSASRVASLWFRRATSDLETDFWTWMENKHPRVPNPNPDGLQRNIAPSTLKDYAQGAVKYSDQARQELQRYMELFQREISQQEDPVPSDAQLQEPGSKKIQQSTKYGEVEDRRGPDDEERQSALEEEMHSLSSAAWDLAMVTPRGTYEQTKLHRAADEALADYIEHGHHIPRNTAVEVLASEQRDAHPLVGRGISGVREKKVAKLLGFVPKGNDPAYVEFPNGRWVKPAHGTVSSWSGSGDTVEEFAQGRTPQEGEWNVVFIAAGSDDGNGNFIKIDYERLQNNILKESEELIYAEAYDLAKHADRDSPVLSFEDAESIVYPDEDVEDTPDQKAALAVLEYYYDEALERLQTRGNILNLERYQDEEETLAVGPVRITRAIVFRDRASVKELFHKLYEDFLDEELEEDPHITKVSKKRQVRLERFMVPAEEIFEDAATERVAALWMCRGAGRSEQRDQAICRIATAWLRKAISEEAVDDLLNKVDPNDLPFDHIFQGKRRLVINPDDHGGLGDLEPADAADLRQFLFDTGVVKATDKIDWKEGKIYDENGKVKSRLGKAVGKGMRKAMGKDAPIFRRMAKIEESPIMDNQAFGQHRGNASGFVGMAHLFDKEFPTERAWWELEEFGFPSRETWEKLQPIIKKFEELTPEELRAKRSEHEEEYNNKHSVEPPKSAWGSPTVIPPPEDYRDQYWTARGLFSTYAPLEGDAREGMFRHLRRWVDGIEEIYEGEWGKEIDALYEETKDLPEERIRQLKSLSDIEQQQRDYALWKSMYGEDLVVVLSRDPVDVLRMSDHPKAVQKIESCHSEGGSEFGCAVDEAEEGGLIAYVVKKSDVEGRDLQAPELFEDEDRDVEGIKPYSRLRLRRFEKGHENDGLEVALPEQTVYGASFNKFVDVMTDWARKEQEELLRGVDGYSKRPSDWTMTGGKYEDTPNADLWESFFDVDDEDRDDDDEDEYDEDDEPYLREPTEDEYDPYGEGYTFEDSPYIDHEEYGHDAMRARPDPRESPHGPRAVKPWKRTDFKSDFWSWMEEKHPKVPNPNPRGRQREITPSTLKGYARGATGYSRAARDIVNRYLKQFEEERGKADREKADQEREKREKQYLEPDTRREWIDRIKEHGFKSPIPGHGTPPGKFPEMYQRLLKVDEDGNPHPDYPLKKSSRTLEKAD